MDMAASASPANEATRAQHPLRVAFVTETYPPEINGVAHTLSHLVEGLRSRGHVVELVRPRQGSNDTPEGRPDLHTVLTGALPIPGYRGLRMGLPARRRLTSHWARQRPDAIYIATEGPLGQSALNAARRHYIPALSGFHTNFDAYTRFYRVGLIEPLVFGYLRRFHNRCRGTLVPTAELAAALEAKGLERVGVLARGVDTTLFHPARRDRSLRREWGLDEEDLAVLFVGRVAAEKNIRLAVAAYEAIARSHPGVRFVVVGDGPLRVRLQQEYPQFVFCGARRGEDLARHYASADLFVFGSTSETYGNVIIEAMASGLPVLCYDYAAGRQHISSGDNGLLVPFADREAFIASALALASDREQCHRLGRSARETAEKLAWERIVERFEDALHAAIDAFDTR